MRPRREGGGGGLTEKKEYCRSNSSLVFGSRSPSETSASDAGAPFEDVSTPGRGAEGDPDWRMRRASLGSQGSLEQDILDMVVRENSMLRSRGGSPPGPGPADDDAGSLV